MDKIEFLSNTIGVEQSIVEEAILEVSGNGGGGNVTSVNTKTGDVVLNSTDVGAIDVSNQATYDSYQQSIDDLTTEFNEFKESKTLHKLEVVGINDGFVIPTTPTNLGDLLGLPDDTFYNSTTSLVTPLNNTSMLNFKFSFNGSFNGGGGQGIEVLATINGATQTFSTAKATNEQEGFSILGWFGIDKDGLAYNNGIQLSIVSVDDEFTIDEYIFSVTQEGKL